jgi:AraC family transcriptional regulator, transcriptional activator FtrA
MLRHSQCGVPDASVLNDGNRYDPVMRSHRVALLAFDGMAPFELGVAAEVFALPRPELDVSWWYSFAICAQRPGPLRAIGGFTIGVPHGLRTLAAADTIVLPGTADVRGDPPQPVLSALRQAHARGARILSICSGAFVLAAAGLLDGLTVTTHWRYAGLLRARFPGVRVDARVLYVDSGQIITSAGTAAGIDACLHIVRSDHGADIANRVARRMVVAPHRDGGQAQFIEQPVPQATGDDPIAIAIASALPRLHERVSVEGLARAAHLSPRQFSRRFAAATGASPGRWLIERRVDASLPLLERDGHAVEAVGRMVGFTSPAAFRRHFHRLMGVSPATYRRRFTAPGRDERR